jgi:hypothetical protein
MQALLSAVGRGVQRDPKHHLLQTGWLKEMLLANEPEAAATPVKALEAQMKVRLAIFGSAGVAMASGGMS